MEKEFFDLLGLGVPFYLAVATYTMFSWLDNNASDEATKVISSWLHGRSHNKPDLGNLIIKAFDRVYTSPLLSLRAFGRSAIISTALWIVIYFIPWLINFRSLTIESIVWDPLKNVSLIKLLSEVTFTLPFVIMSDYISLFGVRRLLVLARNHPIKASIGAFLIGLIILAALASLLGIAFAIAFADKGVVPTEDPNFKITIYIMVAGSFLGVLTPPFIVHLWLPLFALSSLIVKLSYFIFRAVEWAQWFLKQGDAHPLKAIGIVATIIVFGSAMVVKEAWTVL